MRATEKVSDDERRKQAFLLYAKARLKIAKESGTDEEIAHFEREIIELLEGGVIKLGAN